VAFFFALRLQDFEDEVLLAHTAGTGQIQGPCDLGQLGDVLFFQFSNGHDSPARRFFQRRGTQRKTQVQRGRKAGLG
jgi:hypothetical protein